MANVIDILVTARDNASRTLEKIGSTAERAFQRAEQSAGRMQQSFTAFNQRLSQAGSIMRRNGESMIDAGENLSQALALPFLLIGALAVTSAAKTKEGAANIAKLKEGFKQIQTALAPIGNVILKIAVEYMPKIVAATQKVSQAFQNLSPAMQKVVIGLGALAIAIGPVLMFVGAMMLVIGGLIPIFTSLGTAIAGITAPMWGWIAGIAALIAVLVIAWNKSAAFRDVVLSAWEAIKVGFQAVVDYLTPAVTTVVNFIMQQWQKIVTWWTTNGSTIIQAIQNVFNFILPIIMTVINTIIPILQAAWNLIVTIIQTAWSIITTVVSAAVTLILNIISLFANVLTGNWSAAWGNIKTIVVTVWNLIKSVISTALSGISSIISSTMGVIRSVISNVWNGILSIISHVLSTIGNIIRNVWNSAKATISGAMNSIKSLISNGFNAARNSVSNAANSIRSILSGLASQAYSWGSNLISMFGAGVKSKIGSVVAAARNAAAQIKSYLGFSSPTEKGPGANADKWAPNLMSMFSDGMNEGVPKVRMAATNAANATSTIQQPTNTTSNSISRQQPIINIYEAQRTTDKEVLNAMRKAAFLYG